MNKLQIRRLTKSLIWMKNGHFELAGLPGCFFACKKCGGIDDLTIHHEVYPQTKYRIIKAIYDEKIYMLCDSCHKELHGISQKDLNKTNSSDK